MTFVIFFMAEEKTLQLSGETPEAVPGVPPFPGRCGARAEQPVLCQEWVVWAVCINNMLKRIKKRSDNRALFL